MRRLSLLVLSLFFVTACAGPVAPDDVSVDPPVDGDEPVMEEVSGPLYTEGVQVEENVPYWAEENVVGYMAQPVKQGSYPAVILIHEWWGLNDNIKEYARRFAQQGYVALTVDLYDGEYGSTPAEAQQLAGRVRENTDRAFANLNAAVEYLRSLSIVQEDRLASVGWCFGGQWSYEMAKNDLGTAASIMYYGRFSPDDDLSMMKALILGHFGEEDTGIAVDDVREFQAKLETLNGDHQVFIYPNAGHAFANADNKEAYDADAAELAWDRTMEFLEQHL